MSQMAVFPSTRNKGPSTLPITQHIAGHRIEDLAARADGGAFYAYDLERVRQRIKELRQHLPDTVSLYYSPKVNPFPPLLHELSALVDGFDVASGRELKAVLNTQVAPAACLFTGPGKNVEDIRSAVAAGVIVNLESSEQLSQTITVAEQMGKKPRVAFRINPVGLVSGLGLGRYDHSPFGFEPAQLPRALQVARESDARIEGFHGFFGSQFYDVAELVRIQTALFSLSVELAAGIGLERYFVNLGGGFPVGFYEADPTFDLLSMGQAMREWTGRLLPADGRVSLILELGRYLVAEAGYYVARVVDCKKVGDEEFIVLQGGLNHNMLAAGVFGRAAASNARVSLSGAGLEQRRTKTVSVVGPLCTSVDRFATHVVLPEPRIGDYVVIANSGAYGASFSPLNFLGHERVQEMIVRSHVHNNSI